MIDNDRILIRLDDIKRNCDLKRKDLLRSARYDRKLYKIVSFSSGLLSLFSAASMIAVFSDVFSSFIVKVITAALSLISAALSLYASIFIDQKQTEKKFASAAKLAEVRLKADKAKFDEYSSRKEVKERVEMILIDYMEASEMSDELLGVEIGSKYTYELLSYRDLVLQDIDQNVSKIQNSRI